MDERPSDHPEHRDGGGGGRSRRRRRRRRGDRPRAPKLPPPEHGIRVVSIGTTWWGERWVEALSRFGPEYAARLHRGRTYARQGRVHDLSVVNGAVTAFVTGTRPTPYKVALVLRPLPPRTWEQAVRAMGKKARFSAQLLAGEMPKEIDEAFLTARASLFPLRHDDLRTRCSCPDPANPCKHIAAVHYVLGEAFDRDPFLLFELRGRTKDQVLQALRVLRAQTATALPRRAERRAEAETPDAETAEAETAEWTADTYEAFRAPVEDLHFRIAAPSTEGAVLRHLGPPPAWSLETPFADLVQAAVSRAARRARELALDTPSGDAAPSRSPAAAPPARARA